MHRGHERLVYSLGGPTIAATVPTADVATQLAPLYAPYRVDDHRSDGTQPSVVVQSDGDGFVLASRDGRVERYASMGDLVPAFEWSITEQLLRATPDAVHLHAGGIVQDGRSILMLGPTGAGKSSIAFAASCAGATVLGDDTVLVSPDGHVRAFRRLFKITPSVVEDVGVALDDTPWWEPESTEAWYDPGSRSGWADETTVSLVASLEYVAGTPARLNPMPRSEGLAQLLESVQVTGARGAAAFDALYRVAQRARFIRMRHGGAVAAAAALARYTA